LIINPNSLIKLAPSIEIVKIQWLLLLL
jgi:hypothetical protein